MYILCRCKQKTYFNSFAMNILNEFQNQLITKKNFVIFICATCLIIMLFLYQTPNNIIGIEANMINIKNNEVSSTAVMGNWVHKKTPGFQCNLSHRYGCCTKKKEGNLSFVFQNKTIEDYDVKISINEKFRNRNITILGDSLQRQLFFAISELFNIRHVTQDLISYGKQIKTTLYQAKHLSNGWLRMLNFCFLESLKGCPKRDCIVGVKEIKKYTKSSEIIIANLGLHYSTCPLQGYGEILYKFSKELKNNIAKNKNIQIVFRATLPQHFKNDKNNGFFSGKKTECTNYSSGMEHPSNALIGYMAKQFGFKYLNSYHIYQDRFDLHTEQKGDCTHYCYTPELIIPELKLLDQLIE